MSRPLASGLALVAVLLTGACSVFGGQAAPEPAYEVELSAPPFEVRRYAALTIARTSVDGSYDGAISTGFGRLFDYISGANGGTREIAMTAPVLTAEETDGGGTRISMTAPVLTEPAGEATGTPGARARWTIAFVLPDDLTADTAPVPTDPEVEIATIPGQRVAVVRFSGWFGDAAIAENRARLLDWMTSRDLAPSGPWRAAGYNPPWTLPWLRRNEVIIPVE